MGQLTRDLIRELETGGDGARASLLYVSELLRKAFIPGFVPFEELQDEDISNEEACELRRALSDFCEREASPSHRRAGLTILAKAGATDVKSRLIAELHLLLQAHRSMSFDLYQLLLALADIGEEVFPPDVTSTGIDEVQLNVEAASAYLRREGFTVPL